MSFDWADFLTFAEALRAEPESPGPKEAALRSAASRAYYAAFHRALRFASREKYVPFHTGEDHKRVQAYFRDWQPRDKTRQKIATELSRLYDHRRRADYDDTLFNQPTSLAEQAIAMATSVLKNLGSL